MDQRDRLLSVEELKVQGKYFSIKSGKYRLFNVYAPSRNIYIPKLVGKPSSANPAISCCFVSKSEVFQRFDWARYRVRFSPINSKNPREVFGLSESRLGPVLKSQRPFGMAFVIPESALGIFGVQVTFEARPIWQSYYARVFRFSDIASDVRCDVDSSATYAEGAFQEVLGEHFPIFRLRPMRGWLPFLPSIPGSVGDPVRLFGKDVKKSEIGSENFTETSLAGSEPRTDIRLAVNIVPNYDGSQSLRLKLIGTLAQGEISGEVKGQLQLAYGPPTKFTFLTPGQAKLDGIDVRKFLRQPLLVSGVLHLQGLALEIPTHVYTVDADEKTGQPYLVGESVVPNLPSVDSFSVNLWTRL